MTFETLGDKTNPAVLLIHGMMCTYRECLIFGKELADEYYVIMPTLDGHAGDGTDLLTVDKEAEKIISYLKEEQIDEIALIQGSSMGAEVALEVKRQVEMNGIKNRICFFDGGPFFHFTPWFRAVMRMRFKKLVKILDTDDPDKALKDMMNNKFVKFVAKDKIKQSEGMIRSLVSEHRTFSDKTIDNMVDICYRCDLPEFNEEVQKSLIFCFGTEEPARKSRERLLKAYPHAQFIDLEGYSHCGFQSTDPAGYAKMLMEKCRE